MRSDFVQPSDTEIRDQIADVLVEARLIVDKDDPRFGKPLRVLSGKGNVSRVYFYFIPRIMGSDEGKEIVVKVDETQRAEKEKEAWAELEKIQIDRCILGPLHISTSGPIVYEAAQGFADLQRCIELETFLRERLAQDSNSCKKALRMVIDILKSLYKFSPGQMSSRVGVRSIKWSDEFNKLTSPSVSSRIKKTATTVAWQVAPEQGWGADFIRLPDLKGMNRLLPNPLVDYENRLNEDIGMVRLSRIHGDMNLNNCVLGYTFPGQSPKQMFIIDLAKSRTNAVTVSDIARIESEFWQEVYSDVVRKQGGDDAQALKGFVAARNILDWQSSTKWLQKTLCKNCIEVVSMLRHRAADCVQLDHDSINFRNLYHTVLYFTCMQALAFPSIWNSEKGGGTLKARIALIGAALSLEVIIRPPTLHRNKKFITIIVAFIVLLVITCFLLFRDEDRPILQSNPNAPSKHSLYVFREDNSELPPIEIFIEGQGISLKKSLEKDQKGTTIELGEGKYTLKVGRNEQHFKLPEEKLLKIQ
jgi:hypothetical protein